MSRTSSLIWGLLVLLLIAYALPWLYTPNVAGLTNSAYDLAEWMSIHPAVRAEPLLLTSLLLRLPLAALAILIGLSSSRALLLRIAAVILIAVALLPPLEFVTQAQTDPNYQQQAALAAAALILGSIGIVWSQQKSGQRLRRWVMLGITAGAAVAGGWGAARALTLMSGFGLEVQPGVGVIGFSLIAALLIGVGLRGAR